MPDRNSEQGWGFGWPDDPDYDVDTEMCEEVGVDPCSDLPGFPDKVGLCPRCQRRYERIRRG